MTNTFYLNIYKITPQQNIYQFLSMCDKKGTQQLLTPIQREVKQTYRETHIYTNYYICLQNEEQFRQLSTI